MNGTYLKHLILRELVYKCHTDNKRKCRDKCNKAFRRDLSAADCHIAVDKRDTSDYKSHEEHIRCNGEVIKQPRYHKRKAEHSDSRAYTEKNYELDILFDCRQF